MKASIALTPGDGIGPEVVNEARLVLEAIAQRHGHEFKFSEHLLGGCAIDARGTAMPDDTLAAARAADAVLLGAVGGPQWDDPQAKVRPEQGLLAIRKALGLYANVRPVRPYPALARLSPLKAERVAGVDFVVLRELTGGLYFGTPKGRTQTPQGEVAVDTLVYTEGEIRRIVRLAFQMARQRRKLVTSVDKANVLESSRLWRKVAIEVGREFPDVKLEHQLVDSCAMRLITHAPQFDVIVTENMFGDILTDEAAVLAGSLGVLPSASLGEGRLGLYEPIHGSAPDIAGKGIANPTGTILSAALLLRHSLGLEREAREVEQAVNLAIEEGKHTADVGAAHPLTTAQMGEAIRERLDAGEGAPLSRHQD
ncbi:MAG: 3-isopropylmalate dehydrogenase [Opitutaceae bacterium]|nr:3-isopropylmalate dehydrogenase [Opitutaceae bacterium]